MHIGIYVSGVSDGSMKSLGGDQSTARRNRVAFLEKNDIPPENTTLHTLSYGGEDYRRYRHLDESTRGDGIIRDATIDADAVVVTGHHHAVLLPLADCIGAVIYHPERSIFMVSHLGRHNLEQSGGTSCVNYLCDTWSIDPSELLVSFSPSAGGHNYPLRAFDGRSMQDVATEQLLAAGIHADAITTSDIDTTTDKNYFSHSEFLKGHRASDGRFAIVAVLRD